ncbi:hypothetical protein QBC35DRAFT_451936 [Podospora australis]|uniref:Uncharacterized protein n=1 Tax=Podospora australis TaxID=1536484 RepID=A0AAN6WX80_9PEZI|nr:hypothetical protein QBC35DRAFT_451936 [Podospora australis]
MAIDHGTSGQGEGDWEEYKATASKALEVLKSPRASQTAVSPLALETPPLPAPALVVTTTALVQRPAAAPSNVTALRPPVDYVVPSEHAQLRASPATRISVPLRTLSVQETVKFLEGHNHLKTAPLKHASVQIKCPGARALGATPVVPATSKSVDVSKAVTLPDTLAIKALSLPPDDRNHVKLDPAMPASVQVASSKVQKSTTLSEGSAETSKTQAPASTNLDSSVGVQVILGASKAEHEYDKASSKTALASPEDPVAVGEPVDISPAISTMKPPGLEFESFRALKAFSLLPTPDFELTVEVLPVFSEQPKRAEVTLPFSGTNGVHAIQEAKQETPSTSSVLSTPTISEPKTPPSAAAHTSSRVSKEVRFQTSPSSTIPESLDRLQDQGHEYSPDSPGPFTTPVKPPPPAFRTTPPRPETLQTDSSDISVAADGSDAPIVPVKHSSLCVPGKSSKPENSSAWKTISINSTDFTNLIQIVDPPPVAVEPPPWDRSVEVFWRRNLNDKPDTLYDDELSFQQNILHLKDGRDIHNPDGRHALDSDQVGGCGIDTHRCHYFRLPDNVRFAIVRYILSSHYPLNPEKQRAIRLNNTASVLEPIWPVHPKTGKPFWTSEYFTSLYSALSPLKRYMYVCSDMRIDFLAAFFLTRRFHVLFSPFVTESLQPGATLFLDKYGPLMKWIALEIDCTKLGGSFHPSAIQLNQWQGLRRVRELVERFAERQCTRPDGVNIHSFVVLVRRYYGFREGMKQIPGADKMMMKAADGMSQSPWLEQLSNGKIEGTTEIYPQDCSKGKEKEDDIFQNQKSHSEDGDSVSSTKQQTREEREKELVQYTPDAYLCLLDPLKRIGKRIDSLLMCGTTKNYANEFIYAIWGADEVPRGPDFRKAIAPHRHFRTARAYPYTPGQSSVINRYDVSNRHVSLAIHDRNPQLWKGAHNCRLRDDVHLIEQKHTPGSTTYGLVWKQSSLINTAVITSATPKIHQLLIMPPEKPRRSNWVILSRPSFLKKSMIYTPKSSVLSQKSLLSPSVLPAGSDEPKGKTSLRVEAKTEPALEPEPDLEMEVDSGVQEKKGLWRPSKIPLLIKKRARSFVLTRSRSAASDDTSGDSKRSFGKLVKKASSNVLRMGGIFGGRRTSGPTRI